jgi:phosphopantothenoylcysteine decarboxylase/phosphopantothenate--cysteine ligase
MTKVLLGVSGGIAIYKAADLASKLTGRGDEVRTLMTPAAIKFVTPVVFRAVTRQPVYTDPFEEEPTSRPEHITLSEWADVFLLAPATADLIAQIAAGTGDNIVTLTVLAWPLREKPVVVAPAMNDRMWANPMVTRNVATLRQAGYEVLEPATGQLACGAVGAGRLGEVEELMGAVDAALVGGAARREARAGPRRP